jgi:hypothetical protein
LSTALRPDQQRSRSDLAISDRVAPSSDPSPSAAEYRAAQRSLFANVAQVPLSAWSYTSVGEVGDPATLAAAARRLGGAVRILHVRLSYALARVDPEPTTRDLWLTVVSRDGSWKLAGDSDAVDLNDHSWRGLWDFGPVAVTRTAHALVLAHPDHAGQSPADAALIERAVPIVTGVWGAAWNSQVAVLVPDTAAEFAAVTGDDADVSQLAALSIADRIERDSAHPAGLVLGARIVLNPVNLQGLSGPARQLVVQHELTHLAARAVTDDAMPLWVVEGFADYVGNLGSGRTAAQSAPDLAADLRGGPGPANLPTGASFDGANPRLSQVYEQSALACSLIARRVGAAGLVRFYRAVSAAAPVSLGAAAAVALRTVLHTDVSTFTRDWRAYLRAELG